MRFKDEFGPMEPLPTRLYLTGPEIGEQFQVEIEKGKLLNITILAIGELLADGQREVFCEMNGQLRAVFITDKTGIEVCFFLQLSLFSTGRICSREQRKKQLDWLATNTDEKKNKLKRGLSLQSA